MESLLLDFLLWFPEWSLYLVAFSILLACGLGLPIPEDITLIGAGVAAYYAMVDLSLMVVVCFFGVMIGDGVVFLLGAKYGRRLTKKWFFHKLLPDDRLDYVRKKLNEKGDKLLFAARFMPGLRAPVYFSAGTLHVPFGKFVVYDGLAALISVPAIVCAVYYFGDQFDRIVQLIKRVEHGILFVIVAVILAIAAKWYVTHRKLKRQ